MKTSITVTGMTCGHCVQSVTEEISKISGVSEVKVDLENGQVDIESTGPIENRELANAVQEAGYEIK